MAEILFFEDLKPQQRLQIARYVSDYSTNEFGREAKMRPVSFAEMIEDEEVAIVALEGDEFAGYISPGQELYGNELTYKQIGSLLVPEAFRGRGIAKMLVSAATDDVIGEWCIPYAFCNAASMPVFSSVGFELALPGELPPEARSVYDNTAMVYPMHKFINLESLGTSGFEL